MTTIGGHRVPPPGRHGGDGVTVAAELGLDPGTIVDLSASLNPFAPEIAPLLVRRADAVRRYPDPSEATAWLADAMDIDPSRLLVTNGGSEAIDLASRVVGGRVAREPEFSLHPRGQDGPLWRSNPHNPSGQLAGPGEVAGVWDEAYFPLATGSWTAGHDGVVVGSVTKLFACPGLRLGYVIADDVDRFTRLQPEWSVGTLALAVLGDLLDRADLPGWAAAIAARRGELGSLLSAEGFTVHPSDAPWLLVKAPGLRERLAPLGVIVRSCASFGLPDHCRIGVPNDLGLDVLASALTSARAEPAAVPT